MNRTLKILRKRQRKLKNKNKQARLDIEALRKEIYSYQFHFVNQTVWSRSFPVTIEHQSNDVKTKDQQYGSMEVKE